MAGEFRRITLEGNITCSIRCATVQRGGRFTIGELYETCMHIDNERPNNYSNQEFAKDIHFIIKVGPLIKFNNFFFIWYALVSAVTSHIPNYSNIKENLK